MLNIKPILSVASIFMITLPKGKFILKFFPKKKLIEEPFDNSLRNFHPNKGE